MLLPIDQDYQIRKEMYQDQIREIEKARLLRTIAHENGPDAEGLRGFIGHLGTQLIKFGQKLETYGQASSHKMA